MLAGVQKALALPPGLAVFAVFRSRAGTRQGQCRTAVIISTSSSSPRTPPRTTRLPPRPFPHLRAAIHARRNRQGRLRRPPGAPRANQRDDPRLGRAPRLRALRSGRPPLVRAHLLQDAGRLRPIRLHQEPQDQAQLRHQRRLRQNQGHSPSASPTWATKPKPPCRNSSTRWTTCSAEASPHLPSKSPACDQAGFFHARPALIPGWGCLIPRWE